MCKGTLLPAASISGGDAGRRPLLAWSTPGAESTCATSWQALLSLAAVDSDAVWLALESLAAAAPDAPLPPQPPGPAFPSFMQVGMSALLLCLHAESRPDFIRLAVQLLLLGGCCCHAIPSDRAPDVM